MELTLRLPIPSAPRFPPMLRELESERGRALGVRDMGIHVTSIEDIFLKVAEGKVERVFPAVPAKTKDLMVGIPFLTASLLLVVAVAVNRAQLAMLAVLVVVAADTLAVITGLAARGHRVKETLVERLVETLHTMAVEAVEVLAPLVARLLAPLAVMEAQARHLL